MPHRQSCAVCVCVYVCVFVCLCVFANRLLLSTLKCKHPTCGMSVMDSRYRWSLFVACLQPQFPSHSLLQGEAQRDILRGWPDFVIIHWPKSLPCTHRAIFIPGWMYFLGYIIAQPLGADFHFREEVLVFQTLVKIWETIPWICAMVTSLCSGWCMWLQLQCLFSNCIDFVMFLKPWSNPHVYIFKYLMYRSDSRSKLQRWHVYDFNNADKDFFSEGWLQWIM